MEKRDIIEKILTEKDRFQSKSTEELQKRLDSELAKPEERIDYGLVDELTATIIESQGNEYLTADVDDELVKIQRCKARRRKIHFKKFLTGLTAACVMLFCANYATVKAWNMDIVSAVIEFSKSGFLVKFLNDEPEIIELPTSENDPYGMIAECAKYDIYPETPRYLPEGFYLEYIDTNVNENFANTVRFIYRNGRQDFSISYTRYWNEIGQIGIPSDHFNISETEVNGHPAIVSKEDKQYTITFLDEKTLFLMFTRNVPYDECEKVIASIR